MKHFKHNIDKKLTEILLGKKKTHHNREHCFPCEKNIMRAKYS